MGNPAGGTIVSMSPGALIDVVAGTIKNDYANANWAANQSSLNVAAGAFFNLRNNNVSIASLNGAGTVFNDFATNTLTIGVANGTGGNFTGSMGVAGLNVVKTGTGTQTLSGGAINYTGTTAVNAGELVLFNSTGYNSPTTVASSATLSFSGNNNMQNNNTGDTILLNNGATLQNLNPNNWTVINGAVTVPAGASAIINHTVNATAAAGRGFYLDGGLKGTGTVTINAAAAGSGVNFRNNNTNFAGTMIVNGIASATPFAGSGIGVGGNNVLAGLGNANIQLNGTMELLNQGIGWANGAPGDFFMGGLTGTGVMVGNYTATGGQTRVRISNNNAGGTFSGTIVDGTGNQVVLTKNGLGTQILTGANTYTGTTTVAAGILQIGAAGTTGTLGTGPVVDNASLIFNRTNTYLVSNAISGTGTLTQNGSGIVTLAGTNTYTGATFVNAGTLQLQNGAAMADNGGPVNVALGSTLQLLNSETIGSYVGAGDIGAGTNDSLLALGANTLTTTGAAAIANVTTAAGGGIVAGVNITDSDDDNNVIGPNLFMQAGTGVGTAIDPIETAVGAIQLRNTTSGVINVFNRNGGALLTVSDLRTLGFGARNDAGATTVINGSPLTIAASSVSAGPVFFEARDNGSVVNADFNTNNGGFTVVNGGPVEDPWTYDALTGKWFTNGTQNQGVPSFSELNSAASLVSVSGPVTLSFRHRYSFEFDGTRWDGGQVRISVNGGAFTTVPAGSFSAGGYDGVIAGNNILTGQQAFNGDSPGYASNGFVTSVANLGAFVAGDTIRVQFVGAWDEFAEGLNPNWEIDSVSVFTPSAVAGDDLTINAGVLVQSTGSSVTLNAGDNLIVAGNVTSATVTAMNVDSGNSDAGLGGSLNITGVVTTPVIGSGGGTFISGHTDNDTFTFNPQTTTEFRVLGDAPIGTVVGDTLVMNVTGTTNPNLTIPGSLAPYNGLGSGAWSFTSAHRPVLFGSIEQSTITGNYHLTYDNSVTPVTNLIVMRDAGQTNFQLRDGSTAGPIVYQGSLATILSLRILGSLGNDTVTVDDVNTLPNFGGTVPLVTDNGNLAGTAELLFDGLGGTDTLIYNINGATASQQYAIGDGSGAAALQGELESVAAGVNLNTYFQNVELTRRTGLGATPAGLTLIGDSGANSFTTQANAALTRTNITGYTPFEFSGNNYNAFSINALGGADSVDLINFGTAQTNNPAINLSGGSEDDTIRVRSTSLNTGLVTLSGNAGSDLFQLFDAANTVDFIVGPVVVDGTDGNVGGNTDTLTIVDSGDVSLDNILISAVNPAASADYALEGMTTAVGNDVTIRNVDVLNYTSTSANDNIDARLVNTIPLHDLNTVNLSGWTGADQFLLFISDQLGGSGAGFTPSGIASGVASISLFGDAPGNPNAGDVNDTFGATPVGLTGTGVTNVGLVVSDATRMIRPSVSTSITIDGGQPTGLIPPLGDAAGDVLNTDISALPNSAAVVVSTFAPGTVVAAGIQPFTWTQIEDINLVDQGKLTNVQMGDLFARTTPGSDLIQITRNPTLFNPNQVRLRINSTIGNYSVSNKTIMYGGGQNDTLTQSNLTVPAEFYGEDGDDYLTGAMNNDWLVGGLGDDRINGSGGDNVIWGDNAPTLPSDPNPQDLAIGGNDQLSGLGGADVIYGGGGNDVVTAGAGNDYVSGGQGNDDIGGSDGDDRLYGGLGNDIISGHSGNDIASGGAGDDFVYGNTGNDVVFGGTGMDAVDGGDGNDLLVSGSVANETSSRTAMANTATYSSATYTNGSDNDAALITLLAQWGSASNRASIGAITHDGVDDDLAGGQGDDDFCWELADIMEDPAAAAPSDFNAVGFGTDERFGPI
jgi:autotransporter-associated beta strand protein